MIVRNFYKPKAIYLEDFNIFMLIILLLQYGERIYNFYNFKCKQRSRYTNFQQNCTQLQRYILTKPQPLKKKPK